MVASSTVTININSQRRTISSLIYGAFIEHVGECIYDGIWSYSSTEFPMADHPELDKIRRDLLYALKSLRPAVLRWPGGCYADVYHWKDGVGPRSTRKYVENKFWGSWADRLFEGVSQMPRNEVHLDYIREFRKRIGYPEYNQFGTFEFLALCNELSAVPYIVVNYGSGSPEEAANWVEYCNGEADTNYGSLRTMHGRKQPFKVPVWGIGNEIYLENEQGFERDPSAYGKRYKEFAVQMKDKDPGIRLVGCGWNENDWNPGFLKEVEEHHIDFLSIHQYIPVPSDLAQLMEPEHPDNESVYYSMMAAPFEIKKQILKAWGKIVSRFGEKTKVRVAFDEWGIWYTLRDLVKSNYNLQDGLFACLTLMVFQKLSDICPVSLWSMLVNALGMIRVDEEGLILTPVYQVFQLFKNHTYNNLISSVSVESDSFDCEAYGQISKLSGSPFLESMVTSSDDENKVSILMVNKHISDSMTVKLVINGFSYFRVGKLVQLTADSPFDYNTAEAPDNVRITESDIGNINPEMTLELQPHSIAILKLLKLDLGVSI